MAQNLPQISFANKNKISGAKMHHKITILGLLLLMVGVAFAQKVYIKIEGMSPHVLEGMGIMNLDSVSSGYCHWSGLEQLSGSEVMMFRAILLLKTLQVMNGYLTI
jgi:hypothetical protein